jgi:hypothetical protein
MGSIGQTLDWVPDSTISFEDYLGLMTCLVDWADSYDTKDWNRLRKCIAPTLRVSNMHYSPTSSPPLQTGS